MVGTESRKGQEKAAPTFLTITVKLVKNQRVIYSRDTIELGYMCVFSIATALFSWECIPTFISLSRSAFGTLQFLTFVYS